MATTSISITPQFGNNTVTQINCGTSSPRLGGTVDISAFPNLQEFRCNSNDITALSGYAQNSNLRVVEFSLNKVTGSIPSLNALTQLQRFFCSQNLFTGSIPSLSSLTTLLDFRCEANSLSGSIPPLPNNIQLFSCYLNNLTGRIPLLPQNIRIFLCQAQKGNIRLTGPLPSFSGLNFLQDFRCEGNQITGSIPSLNELGDLKFFYCFLNQLTGPIPSLSGLNNLQIFQAHANQLTGTIPSLSGLNNLQIFQVQVNQLSGPIPSLSGLNQLEDFRCATNQITNFDGGSVSNTLGNFQAQNNQLTQSSVNAILSAFVVANRTTGTRVLNVGGTGNSAPSYTGGVTTTSPGSNFSRTGTLVTANVNSHGHVTGNIVTIDGITPTVFQGTFAVTRITDNQFQYTTISSGAATGAGTATMRKTSDPTSGYASYQNLALVSRTGGPWDITINQP